MGSKHRQGNHPLLNPNTPAAGTQEEPAQHTSSCKTCFSYFRQGNALLNAHRKAATATLPPRLQGMQRISQLFSLLWGSSQLFLAQLTADVKGASKKGQHKTTKDGGSSNSLGSSLVLGTALLPTPSVISQHLQSGQSRMFLKTPPAHSPEGEGQERRKEELQPSQYLSYQRCHPK